MARQPEIQYIRYYADGSAARKPEPILPRKQKTTLPKVRRKVQQVIYVDPLAIGGIVVSAIMFVLMMVGSIQLISTAAQVRQLEDYVTQLQEQNHKLQEDYASQVNLDEIQEYALALGMVPVEQAQQYTIQVELEEPVRELTYWERVIAFWESILA